MSYRFKPLQELYWALLTGCGIVLFQALLTLQPEQITDWQTWAVALLGALVRAVGGAGIDYVRRSMAEPEPTLADHLMSLSSEERIALIHEIEVRNIERDRQWLKEQG